MCFKLKILFQRFLSTFSKVLLTSLSSKTDAPGWVSSWNSLSLEGLKSDLPDSMIVLFVFFFPVPRTVRRERKINMEKPLAVHTTHFQSCSAFSHLSHVMS